MEIAKYNLIPTLAWLELQNWERFKNVVAIRAFDHKCPNDARIAIKAYIDKSTDIRGQPDLFQALLYLCGKEDNDCLYDNESLYWICYDHPPKKTWVYKAISLIMKNTKEEKCGCPLEPKTEK